MADGILAKVSQKHSERSGGVAYDRNAALNGRETEEKERRRPEQQLHVVAADGTRCFV
jgi:hypothetical protein